MAIDISIIQHTTYLEFVISGSHDLQDAIHKFSHVLALCRQTGLTRVLIDYRTLAYPAGGTEKTLYALGTERQYREYIDSGGHELQLAYLAPVVMSYEPGADIGRSIDSLQFELFDTRHEALQWLGVNST